MNKDKAAYDMKLIIWDKEPFIFLKDFLSTCLPE